MTSLLRSVTDQWHYWFTESVDERTKGWFMVGSPIPPIVLMIAYYRFVKIYGPELMKNRKPFNIDRIIQIYNIGQVLVCSWLSFETFRLTYGPNGDYSLRCQPMDKSLSPKAYYLATLTWIYYMLKLCDLLDTVFFVLRKKNNQITFLHVYHHIGVIALGYFATTFYPDGHGIILVTLNSFVHSIMYTYYFLTNYNSKYKKNLWWKKHITQIQIAQFVFFMVHAGKLFFISDCDYPLFPIILFFPQNVIISVLFINFYIQTYILANKPVKSS